MNSIIEAQQTMWEYNSDSRIQHRKTDNNVNIWAYMPMEKALPLTQKSLTMNWYERIENEFLIELEKSRIKSETAFWNMAMKGEHSMAIISSPRIDS